MSCAAESEAGARLAFQKDRPIHATPESQGLISAMFFALSLRDLGFKVWGLDVIHRLLALWKKGREGERETERFK